MFPVAAPVPGASPALAARSRNDGLPQHVLGAALVRLPLAMRATGAARVCRTWRELAQPSVAHRVAGALRGVRGEQPLLAALRAYPAAELARMDHLDLRGRGLGDGGARRVCSFLAARAPALRFLDLSDNALSGRGAAMLPLPARLDALNLAGNDLADDAPLALPRRLRALNLSCNPRLGSGYLAAQRWPASLELLAVAGCAVRFWQPPRTLRHLDVSGNAECSLQARDPGTAAHVDTRGTAAAAGGAWPSRHAAHPLPEFERLLLRPLHDARGAKRAVHVAAVTGCLLGLALGTTLGAVIGEWECVVVLGLCGAVVAAVSATELCRLVNTFHNREAIRTSKGGGAPWHAAAAAPRPSWRAAPRHALEALGCGAGGGVLVGYLAAVLAVAVLAAVCQIAVLTLTCVLVTELAAAGLGGGPLGSMVGALVGLGLAAEAYRIWRRHRPRVDAWLRRILLADDSPARDRLAQSTAAGIRMASGRLLGVPPGEGGAPTWRAP